MILSVFFFEIVFASISKYSYDVNWGFIYEEKFDKKDLMFQFGLKNIRSASLIIEKPYEKKIYVRRIESTLLSIENVGNFVVVKFFVPDEFNFENDVVTRGDRRLFTHFNLKFVTNNNHNGRIGGPLFFKEKSRELIKYTRLGDIEDVYEMITSRLIEFNERLKAFPEYCIKESIKTERINLQKLKIENGRLQYINYKLKALDLLLELSRIVLKKNRENHLILREEYFLQDYLNESNMSLELLVKEKIEEFYVKENKLNEKFNASVDQTIKEIKSDMKEKTMMGYEVLNIMAYLYMVISPARLYIENFKSNSLIFNGQYSLENSVTFKRAFIVNILDASGNDVRNKLDIEILFYKNNITQYGMQTTYFGRPLAIPLESKKVDYGCPITIEIKEHSNSKK